MKKMISLLGLFTFLCGMAQTANVTYTASSAVISNPERGFYKYSDAHSDDYEILNQNTLTNYRLNNNITLVYRYFYLENFLNSPISATYLSNMQTDFNRIRNAGLKCIIRFAYSSDENGSQLDASKTLMLSHILQIKPLLIANADVISVMQTGFIGAWGEWYFTSQPEFGGSGYNGNELTSANINHRKDVVNAILNALPASRMLQIRTPAFKQDMYSQTALPNGQAYNETNLARIGHHNDCFLASADDYGTYDNPSTQYPYLAQETKFLPMGGETCAVNSPRTDCTTAVFEMNKFHWSFLNRDYNTDVIEGFEEDNCYTDIQKRLGYRFELKSGVYQQSANAGSSMNVTLTIKNNGFAAPFNERNAYIVLKNTLTNQIYPLLMNSDPRLWLSTDDIVINETLSIPANVPAGSYKLYLNLPDSDEALSTRPEYSIRLANEAMWDSPTGFNNLNHIMIINAVLGVADNSKLNLSVYPVPANEQLTVEMEGIGDFKILMYNALGQNVNAVISTELNRANVATQNLSNGVYFIEFTKGNFRDTRKIIVRH